MDLLWFVLVGALSGWIANRIMKRGEKGFLRNMLLGIAGSIVGGFVFGLLGIHTDPDLLGKLITSLAGALLVIWLADKIQS